MTADGVELMTCVPRTVEEIEALMAEGQRQQTDRLSSVDINIDTKI